MQGILLSDQSFLWQLLQAYGLGFLASFTPCVFPLIPITLSLFGARETSSRLKGFLLASCYVAGIAATYTALGMASAKLNIIFGAALGNPWVILAICIFLLAIALNTFEMLDLPFMGTLQTEAGKVGGKGYGGAFLMGTVSGFVAAPCMGPALVIILGAAAASKSVTAGAALLFTYSIGMGTIFLVLGAFSNLIAKLPKAGNWLNAMKFFLGVLLILVMIFLGARYLDFIFAELQLPEHALRLLFMENLGIYLAWYSYRHNKKVIRLIAAVLMAFALYQFFIAVPHSAPATSSQATPLPELKWHSDIASAITQSKEQKKIVMVDLYADWCAACKEMDAYTFANGAVKEVLGQIIIARIDFTETDSKPALEITERYGIQGLPTILFLKADGSGEEIESARITGFTAPAEFIAHIKKFQ